MPRARIITLYAILALANLAAWAWALVMFRHQPVLLGTALLAYGFGLRHAVDADHIAAIDNATRKLMQSGQRPVGVGFFFALGHSAVVALAAAAVAATAAATAHFPAFREAGGLISTAVSSLFLFVLAAANLVILRSLWAAYRRARAHGAEAAPALDPLLDRRGLLARLFRPLFRLVTASWHMLPVGFLFGLGFDTATEVALLGISATEAARGASIWSIMLFPSLFAAGMTLIDTTDGVLMLRAYTWAFVNPLRKLTYNLAITALSILVALGIGGIEALGLIGGEFGASGGFWNAIDWLQGNFNAIGFAIIGAFILAWLGSMLLAQRRSPDPATD